MNTEVMFSSKTDEWETPQDFFDEWDQQFHFTLDACASQKNHKCERYFSKEDNGLEKDWGGETVWCNPPVWPEHWPVGKKVLAGSAKERHEGCGLTSCTNRYKMVSRICVL